MTDWQLKTPVAFIIFNRPDTTERVFQVIRQAKPPKLLVVADGPRTDRPGEAEKCAAARAIIERVDWKCEVMKNYSDINLGCRERVSSGLNWVFKTVEEAIILEDDCLPHYTFFRFCEELLDYYRNDKRIMSISGDNSRWVQRRTEYSYYFSRLNPIWGWATWQRAWQYYDVKMKLWPIIRDGNWHRDILKNNQAVKYWEHVFQSGYERQDGQFDTWDYQWTFACWIQNGLNIISNVNLVSNVGFNVEATHTTDSSDRRANMQVEAMSFPLQHPPFVINDIQTEEWAFKQDYPGLLSRIQRKVKKIFLK